MAFRRLTSALPQVTRHTARAGAFGQEFFWKARAALIPAPYAEEPSWAFDRALLAHSEIVWPQVYDWPYAGKWVEPLLSGFQRFVRVRKDPLTQPYHHVVLFRLNAAGKKYTVAIDYADKSDISPECAENVLVYFKMQYRSGGYPYSNVVPGGFVPADPSLYGYLPLFRHLRSAGQFRYDVYGRFSTEFAEHRRKKAVELLRQQKLFNYEGGLKRVRYGAFLHEAARSKICIDLPGNGDFCFRLCDYLGLGCCVIAAPHRNTLHVPLRDRETIVYTKPDLSNLVELCDFYLRNSGERERIAMNARRYFDSFLSRDQLVGYYLNTILASTQVSNVPSEVPVPNAAGARASQG